jgi:hypothetical protein
MSLMPPFDVIAQLPPGAADRLRALRQRFHDTNTLIAKFEAVRETNTAKIEVEQRLRRLLDHQQDGGFHLKPDEPRVVVAQQHPARLTAEAQHLTELQGTRSRTWRAASHVLSAVEARHRHQVARLR